MIRFESVSKVYSGHFQALKNISFNIQKGEMIFIAGHSGAGKSTVLRLIAGITKPTSGKVLINKHNLGDLTAFPTTSCATCASTSASCFKTTKSCSTATCCKT